MPERTFIIRASTAGSPSRSYRDQGGGYRWRKTPGWTPGDVRFRQADAQPASGGDAKLKREARAQRLRDFAAARDEGLSVRDAGHRVNVQPKTAREYEKARLAAIREAQP